MSLKNLKKKISRHKAKLVSRIHDKPLAQPDDKELELIEELRSNLRELSFAEAVDCPDSERKWSGNSNCLKELVLTNDAREFLRWHAISGSMFVKHAGYIEQELKYLKSLPDWDSRWAEAIKECSTGHPIPYHLYPKSSANLIHHAYHWAQFEEKTGVGVNNIDFIFEFGGGYGSMCRLLYNLGFRGNYLLFDLPAFSALQKFFLKSIGVRVHSIDSFNKGEQGAICISELEQLKEILSERSGEEKSMFIATWSISEAPVGIRALILPFISRFNAFLIAYQHQFKEVDNVAFFKDWKTTQEDINWYEWEIEHIKRSWYLVGQRMAHFK
jgi:hypothetical protein